MFLSFIFNIYFTFLFTFYSSELTFILTRGYLIYLAVRVCKSLFNLKQIWINLESLHPRSSGCQVNIFSVKTALGIRSFQPYEAVKHTDLTVPDG